jgi:hypothetical protein
MKKVFFSLILMLLLPAVMKADPPKKIALSYDAETQKLKIEVTHPSQNVLMHYVETISISVNGKEVNVLNLQSQTDKKRQLLEVIVPEIVKGSEVSVTAKCNQTGSKSESMKF